MAIQYSGGTLINRTFSVSVRQDWVTNVTQACSDAGWTTISGTVGGGSDVTLETQPGNQGQKCRVRFLEPGSGNCAQAFIRNLSGSLASAAFFAYGVSPPAQTWRIVATKFQFFTTISGSGNRLAGRSNICGGILYVPTFLILNAGDTAAYMMGNGQTDTDSGTHNSWRTTFRQYDNANSGGRFAGLFGQNGMDITNYTNQTGNPTIACWQGGQYNADLAYRWEDQTIPIYEPLVAWGSGTVQANEGRLKGQIYDAIVLNGSFVSETNYSLDGHTWLAWTDQVTGGLGSTGSLFLAAA